MKNCNHGALLLGAGFYTIQARRHRSVGLRVWLCWGRVLLLLSALSLGGVFTAWAANPYVLRAFKYHGKDVGEILVPGSPPPPVLPPTVQVPEPQPEAGVNALLSAPAFTWCYGCSATSAAMLMGYYDQHGYGNMYTGPANGSLCPLNNELWWGHSSYSNVTCGECPLAASHLGTDGRITRGHVDDYWIAYNNSGLDPYQLGGWTEHAPDSTADFMGTSQVKCNNYDGSTRFYFYADARPLYDYTGSEPWRDGCHGLRLFAQALGFTVIANYSQYIYGYTTNAQGFTYDNFKSEIDAGRPVLIQLFGHTLLGYGYNETGTLVYVHDTWDNHDHAMAWGGSYSGMQHFGVTCLQLGPASPPGISTPPADVTVRAGRLGIFTVVATGEAPHYYWKRNGIFIPGATASSYSTGDLHLSDSSSQFSCLVSNVYDTTNSRGATLTVLPQRPLLDSVGCSNGTFSFCWSAIVGENIQVQFKASLLQAEWANLGGSFHATNALLRISQPVSGPGRFYRVVLLP